MRIYRDRAKLLELSRERVHERGYQYRKGTSRSKRLQCGTKQQGKPKRPKISEDVRLRRISELEEDIKDATDQIKIKEKRRNLASTAHQYKDCDRLTSQISMLRQKLRENKSELIQIQKKQRNRKWYKDKRSQPNKSTTPCTSARSSISPCSTPSTSALSITSSPAGVEVPCSSRFCTPPPVMSPQRFDSHISLTSPSPMTTPSPLTSPMFCSSESESENHPHEYGSHDTVILSSEAELADEQDPQLANPSALYMDNGEDSSAHFR